MQGRVRVLILVALVIVVVALLAVFLLNGQNDGDSGQPTAAVTQQQNPNVTVEPSPTPPPTQELVDIVVAIQAIPRGSVIPPDAVRLQPFPLEAAPFNSISSTEDVIGMRARTDIFIEQPILTSLVVDDLVNLADTGSDAAAIIPNGLVGVALPMDRITSVAYAIQPGDRVDIIVSLLYVDIDEEFQSLLPNDVNLVSTTFDEETNQVTLNVGDPVGGRFESITIPAILNGVSTSLNWPVVVSPSENPRPRLVTQRTVQDALVLNVGNFPANGVLFADAPTPTPIPAEDAPQQPAQQNNQNQAVPPTPTPARPDIVALAVTPQESVILTWMVEAGIPITFTLRAAADTSRVPTDPVTLDYIMGEYNITVPAKRGFSIQPAITSIRQLVVDSTISLND